MIVPKEQFLNSLRSGKVQLTFKKKDGSIREMLATLDVDYIAEHDGTPKAPVIQTEEQPTFRVFDCNINEWRSVIFENIIEVK